MVDIAQVLKNHAAWLAADQIGPGRADLRRANLDRAYLHGADLRGADLRGADLRETDLRLADLRLADLRLADLRGADLYEADLHEADLRGADLYEADLRGAKGIVDAGTDPRGYRFIGQMRDDMVRVIAGCRNFTIPEAVAHWTAKGNQDALARVAEIERRQGELA